MCCGTVSCVVQVGETFASNTAFDLKDGSVMIDPCARQDKRATYCSPQGLLMLPLGLLVLCGHKSNAMLDCNNC